MPKKQFYDYFLNNPHTPDTKSFFLGFNKNIIRILFPNFTHNNLKILEIGPGKGYFNEALNISGIKHTYQALDRNKNILKKLNIPRFQVADMGKKNKIQGKYDLIFASYVLEHLENPRFISDFLINCHSALKPGGRLALVVPDALSQKMEFWNEDYTHFYPTTRRNILMSLVDNGFKNVQIEDFNYFSVFLTFRFRWWRIILLLSRLFLIFYNYRIIHSFIYLFKNDTGIETDSTFYKIYQMFQAGHLLVISYKD